MRTYRAGIIGLGRMGSTICDEVVGYPAFALPYSIAASCLASERLELTCGADTSAERREAFAARHGVDAVYEDFREMIERENLDLVAVCTRGDTHAPIGIEVAEMGAPMLYVEKAIAGSMAEADALRDACVRHKTVFNTGVMRRFDDRYQHARSLIEEGQIGRPHSVVQYSGGNLLHSAIHTVDTMLYLLGDPAALSVRGELHPPATVIENNRLDHDPCATFEIEFEGGVTGYAIAAGNWDIEVFGSEGIIRAHNNGIDWGWRKPAKDADKWQAMREAAYPKVGFRSSTLNCLEDMVEAYETGRQTLSHIEQAHHAMEICLAVAESHRQGCQRVKLPLENRELYISHV
ncbi:MAG: Gfo/Idh/MocA family oxidoreductase [Armatimonadia bacterium]